MKDNDEQNLLQCKKSSFHPRSEVLFIFQVCHMLLVDGIVHGVVEDHGYK